MTAKEYLEQIYHIDNRIKRLNETRAAIRIEMYSVKTPTLSANKVTSSMSGDAMLRIIARADEVDREMALEVKRLIETRNKICKQIEGLPKEKHRQVLYMRYVLFKRMERIADDMDKTVRHVYRLRDEALAAFEEKYL